MTNADLISLGIAIGTGLLAIATFVLVWYTGHLRHDDIDRQFKSRLLDEIQDWAQNARRYFINLPTNKWENLQPNLSHEVRTELEDILLPHLNIERSAVLFGSELARVVRWSFELLRNAITILRDEPNPVMTIEGSRVFSEDGRDELAGSFRYVLETVFKIKSRHKL